MGIHLVIVGRTVHMSTIVHNKTLENSKQTNKKGLSYSITPEYHPQSNDEALKDGTEQSSIEQCGDVRP